MGLVFLKLEVANPSQIDRWVSVECLLDSGAVYSVIPASVLDSLGIKTSGTQEFRLPNGKSVSRRKGVGEFRHGGKVGGADVIFGEPGDSVVLGLLTLNALGLWLDPLRRELGDLPMTLADYQQQAA